LKDLIQGSESTKVAKKAQTLNADKKMRYAHFCQLRYFEKGIVLLAFALLTLIASKVRSSVT